MPPIRALLPLVSFVSLSAYAQTDIPSVADGFGQMLMGLVIVIALLLVTLWLIKRLSAPRGPAAGLKVLGGVSVGSRERLMLVEIGDKVLVLGVTAHTINTLHTLDADSLPRTPTPASAPSTQAQTDFGRWLKRSLERRQEGG